MKTFDYKIREEIGIHARPAGMLARKAKEFTSKITIEKDGRCVNIANLISLMEMGVECNEIVKVTVEGADEDLAFDSIKTFFEENL